MTEPTLFEMHVPKPEPAKKEKKARSAGWFPKTNGEMLMRGYIPGTATTYAKCRGCSADIEWWTTPTGRALPMNPMPTPDTPAVAHWSTCPKADSFRKGKA